jgi:glycosyltransferase involved in cell wall biosynthesis
LLSNVNSGAYFACVSEATRRDLVSLFPQAEARAVTIHNMISPHYYYENSLVDRVPEIIRARFHADLDGNANSKLKLKPDFSDAKGQEKFFQKNLNKDNLKYLLIVSTIEPRKNHIGLISAWEQLKSETDNDLKLVIVGSLGWDYQEVLKAAAPWINIGEIFMIEGVPARDLRVLYRHATATVCPSLAEGFDFSGVEAMSCGGVVVASDIAVHREVYDDAAEFFDPYSTSSLVAALHKLIYASDAGEVQEGLRQKGRQVSARYLPDIILPKWQEFLDRVVAERS